ncbi:MAG TPA: (Fe-S)-binding protein [Baekduia sp.]|nr:(Fe-S)-binding protein [Baekduia sp.]
MLIVAAEASREVFWHTPVGLKILWYVLATASVAVFAIGFIGPIRRWRRGGHDRLPPMRDLPRRIGDATRLVLSHRTIARRSAAVGWAHRGIFYGWMTLFAGTVIVLADTDVAGPIFGFHFLHGDFYLAFKAALNILGSALLAGLLAMMVRRAFVRPRRLDYTRPDREPDEPQYDRRRYRAGDWVAVGALLIITLTGFLLEGVRMAMDTPGYNAYQFGGWVVAQGLDGIGASDATLGTVRHATWWFHGLLAITVVAAIPYTKAAHMFTSFASLVVRNPQAGVALEGVPADRELEPVGYATLSDFDAVHLLQLDACTRCGRCHDVCPANAMGMPLSPRDVVLELHEQGLAATPRLGGVLGGLLDAREDVSFDSTPVVRPDGVRSETIWSCMQCNACVDACPVGIEQAPIINMMRRAAVEEGELAPTLQTALEAVGRVGNSFGRDATARGSWTDGLDFEVKDARKQPVDVLWFVGDYASFDEGSLDVTRATARLLHAAGVDFGILFDGERTAGNDVRRVGEEGLFESLARHNVETLSACSFNRIVTTDPHSLNTLRNEYPQLGGHWDVVHHTDLLLELIEAGRLDVAGRLDYRVTFHDPCHLGRFNGGYEAPRRLLDIIGCELIEMPRNRESSFCCGAGGGKIWMPDKPGAERPSENRIREAVGLGELDFFVVTCPKDVTMYGDAIRATGNDDRLALRELTELIAEALEKQPAPALQGATA